MFRVSAAVTLFLAVSASNAFAFGDVCLKDVAARGVADSSMSRAHSRAIEAWEKRVKLVHGRRFANWWYSGDRQIDCSWDKSGRRIWCNAVAIPCARKR